MHKDIKEVLLFCLLTLGAVYLLCWGPLVVTQTMAANIAGDVGPWWAVTIFILGGFIPSIMAMLLVRIREGRPGFKNFMKELKLKIGLRSYLFCLIVVTLSVSGIIVILYLLDIDVEVKRLYKNWFNILPLLFLGPVSEEFGWRGYVLKRFLKHWSGLKSSFVLGIIWSFWHLPLFFIPGTSQNEWDYTFIGFLIGVTSSSIFYTVIYIKTNGSIWSAIVMHWVYTYITGEILSSIERTELFNRLESIPVVIVASIVFIIYRKILLKKPDLKAVVS